MAKNKSEVSILVSAKDTASRIIKQAADTVVSTTRQVAAATERATAATKATVNEWTRAASAAAGFGNAAKGAAAGLQQGTTQTTAFGRSLNRILRDLQEANAAFKAGKLSADDYKQALHFAEAEIKALGSTSRRSKAELLVHADVMRTLKQSMKDLSTSSVTVRQAFRDLAAEIPFLNRGLSLATAFFTSLPGILVAVGGGLALIGLKALAMADRVQDAINVLRNQIPGAEQDLQRLKDTIEDVSRRDPAGRTQEEIAQIGRVLAKNGVDDVKAFAEALELVVQAANASGESTEALAEGLDLLADAFQLSGPELAETFAKIVVAANGLVPLPELFQALTRGSTTLDAFGVSAETAARAAISFAEAGIPSRESGMALIRVLDQLKDLGRPLTDTLKDQAAAAKALGVDIGKLQESGASLPQILRALQNASAGSADALEAMGFTLKEATAIIRGDFSDSTITGAEALEKMEKQAQNAGESVNKQFKQAMADMNAILINLGQVALPPVVDLLRGLREILERPITDSLTGKLRGLIKLADTITSRPTLEKFGFDTKGPSILARLGFDRKHAFDTGQPFDAVNRLEDDIPVSRNSLIRDEAFDPNASKTEGETPAQRATRVAREAAEARRRAEEAKKALQEQIALLETRIALGRDDAADREKVIELEEDIRNKLQVQNLSVERRLELEQTLGKLQGLREGLITREINVIAQRNEAGKATKEDAQRLSDIYNEAKTRLEDQTITIEEQLRLYQRMFTTLQLIQKIKLPSPGANLGPLLDPTRQGATEAEERLARDAANRPGGLISGVEGRGPSDLTEQRAKAAEEAVARAKQRTDEFAQAMNDAIAGPIAEFFKSLTDGFDKFSDVALAALNAVADAVINIFSQQAADNIANALFPEPKDPLLKGAEGAAAIAGAEARSAQPLVPGGDSVDVAATTATVTAGALTVDGLGPAGAQLEDAATGLGDASNAVAKGGLSLGDAAGLMGAAALAFGGLAKGKVGGLLGGIAGFLLGGPAGASLGAGIGSQLGFAHGGVVKKKRYADGGVATGFFSGVGMVRGPGGPTSDSVPAYLSSGEGVLTARTTQLLGGEAAINYLNQLTARPDWFRAPRFADGGVVGAAREPGRAEVTLTLPPGVHGETRGDNDIVRVVIANRRVLRDILSDN